MTKLQMEDVLLKMSALYQFFDKKMNGPDRRAFVSTWHEFTGHLPLETFSDAVSAWIKAHDDGKDVPVPASILKIINSAPRDTAGPEKQDGWIYKAGEPRRRPWEVWCTKEEAKHWAGKFRKILEDKGIRRI